MPRSYRPEFRRRAEECASLRESRSPGSRQSWGTPMARPQTGARRRRPLRSTAHRVALRARRLALSACSRRGPPPGSFKSYRGRLRRPTVPAAFGRDPSLYLSRQSTAMSTMCWVLEIVEPRAGPLVEEAPSGAADKRPMAGRGATPASASLAGVAAWARMGNPLHVAGQRDGSRGPIV